MEKSPAITRAFFLVICLFVAIGVQGQESGGRFDTATQAKAAQDLRTFEERLKTSDRLGGFYLLSRLAPTALAAGDTAKASDYAKQLLAMATDLQKDWNFGNAIHIGNLVLGEIALDSGDISEAKRYLLQAGETPGSPQLNSFGPNMLLARELLEKGERETVLRYFELCGHFWELGPEKLESWSATVKNGSIPKFGANLVYGMEYQARAAL